MEDNKNSSPNTPGQQNPVSNSAKSATELKDLRKTFAALVRDGDDFNDIIKDQVRELGKLLTGYDKVRKSIDGYRSDTLDIKQIEKDIQKNVVSKVVQTAKLKELEEQISKQRGADQKNADRVLKLLNTEQIARSKGITLSQEFKDNLQDQIDLEMKNLHPLEAEYVARQKSLDLIKVTNKELEKEREKEEEIQKGIGIAGGLASQFSKKLGIGTEVYKAMVLKARELQGSNEKIGKFTVLKAGLSEIKKSIKESLSDPLVQAGLVAGALAGTVKAASSGLKTVGNLASQGMSALTGTGGPIASFVSPFTNLIKQIPLVGGLIGGVADMFANLADFATEASSQSELLARSLNLSAGSGAALNVAYSNAAHASGDLLFNSKKFRDVQIEIAQATGLNNLLSTRDLETQVQLKELHGIDLETRKELTNVERVSGVQQDRIVKSVMGTASYLSKTLGVSFKWQSVLKEATSLSGYLGLTFAKYPEKLTKALLTTKSMGLELSKLDSMADSFLDFESSISKEFEAQLITGKDINLAKAREAFLDNNLVLAAKEITRQVGSSTEFTKMRRIEQESLAAAMGMSRNEMADMLKQQELFAKLGATSLQDYQKKVSVMSETIEGQKQLVALLGQEEYSRQMNQTATEKIASFIDKIKQSFADLLGNSSFKTFIDKIITFISDPKQIENLLSKITGFISTMIRAVATVLDGLDQLPFVDIDRGIISSIRGYADELSSAKIGALSTAGVSVGANQANSSVASSKGAASNADSGRMPVGKPAIIFNDYSRIDPITAQKTKDMVITSVNFDGVTGQLKSQT
jgi:plasmid maintenance system antidote protein VapI